MTMLPAADRRPDVQRGVRLAVFTVAWMVVEAVLALRAGVVARSLLLVAFGLDSVVELISGTVLLWRLSVEAGSGDLEQLIVAPFAWQPGRRYVLDRPAAP